DLLEGGDEVFVEVLAGFGVSQGVHTERLGVVSGEARVFKVAGEVQHEEQLLLLPGQFGRLGRRLDKLHGSTETATGVGRRLVGRPRRGREKRERKSGTGEGWRGETGGAPWSWGGRRPLQSGARPGHPPAFLRAGSFGTWCLLSDVGYGRKVEQPAERTPWPAS